MDIEFENEVKTDFFCNIRVGDCFAFGIHTPDEMVCMKIDNSDTYKDNAVDLQNGQTLYFADDDEIILIDAKLKVRLGG